ncbi:MAG: hypothetical protein WB762_06580 [Candidatus Sulfotelmatobacter sp.]
MISIVEVRNTLYGRLRIVAALTILMVELATKSVLVTQCHLFDFQGDRLARFILDRWGEFIAAHHAPRARLVVAWPPASARPFWDRSSRLTLSTELDEGVALLIIHLHDPGLLQANGATGAAVDHADFG